MLIQNELVQVQLHATTHIHSHDLFTHTTRDTQVPLACEKVPMQFVRWPPHAYRVAWQDSYVYTQHPTPSPRASSTLPNSIMLEFHSRPSEHTYFLRLTSPQPGCNLHANVYTCFKVHRNHSIIQYWRMDYKIMTIWKCESLACVSVEVIQKPLKLKTLLPEKFGHGLLQQQH